MAEKLSIKDVVNILEQARVNGAEYKGEELPVHRWNWPKDTYLQRKLRRTADVELVDGELSTHEQRRN